MLFLLDKIIRYILYYIYLVRSYGIAFNLELLLHEMYTCTPKYISLHMISFENVVDLVCVPIAKSHVLHKHTHTPLHYIHRKQTVQHIFSYSIGSPPRIIGQRGRRCHRGVGESGGEMDSGIVKNSYMMLCHDQSACPSLMVPLSEMRAGVWLSPHLGCTLVNIAPWNISAI